MLYFECGGKTDQDDQCKKCILLWLKFGVRVKFKLILFLKLMLPLKSLSNRPI